LAGFSLVFSMNAASQMEALSADRGHAKRLKTVRKTLGRLEIDPRHPGLQSHKIQTLAGSRGEDVFESYAEQATPAAFRVFWHYGPGKSQITIVAITRHP
jgi:hypothetical protein